MLKAKEPKRGNGDFVGTGGDQNWWGWRWAVDFDALISQSGSTF